MLSNFLIIDVLRPVVRFYIRSKEKAMLGFLDFVVGIVDFLANWRLGFGLALTAFACLLIVLLVPNHAARWILCVPIGLVGMFFTFRWQHRADSQE
jgi:hypothetical protein